MAIKNPLLGMSYNMPKMSSSEFQTCSIKIEDFKINPINPFYPISIKGGSEDFKCITKMYYNMPKKLRSEYQSHRIKIEDLEINTFNPFNPISTKGGGVHFKPITTYVL